MKFQLFIRASLSVLLYSCRAPTSTKQKRQVHIQESRLRLVVIVSGHLTTKKKVYLYDMITPQQQNIIKTVTQRVKPTLVGVFGSYARGEENEKSDLDILIDFDTKVDLLELIGLEQELSELLGIKVDLITLRSVNASLKPYIESDLIRLI
ncbi:MAG: nucleotidyltransferase family protein [Lutibacter sp.]